MAAGRDGVRTGSAARHAARGVRRASEGIGRHKVPGPHGDPVPPKSGRCCCIGH